MPYLLGLPLLVVLSSSAPGVLAETVQFFYNRRLDTCNWGTTLMPAQGNTANGGMCAYVPNVDRVYACPAPDATCWTRSQKCTGNGSEPNPKQRRCDAEGYVWCCSIQEICTVAKGQINVCVGQFRSANDGVSPSDARLSLYSAIPSSVMVTTEYTSWPSIVAMATFLPDTTTTISSNANATSSKSTSRTSFPSETLTADPMSTSVPGNTSTNPVLSSAAIAGIIIGALAGLAMILATVIYLVRDKHRGIINPETPISAWGQSSVASSQRPYGMGISMSESCMRTPRQFRELNGASTRSSRRAEMPEHHRRHEMQ